MTTIYTTEQRKLEACFYVVRKNKRGEEIQVYPAKNGKTAVILDDAEALKKAEKEAMEKARKAGCSEKQWEKRIALLTAFYSHLSSDNETSPFDDRGRLDIYWNGDCQKEYGPTRKPFTAKPNPMRFNDLCRHSLGTPSSEGSEE